MTERAEGAPPEGAFRFPDHMTETEAAAMLREAYEEIDAGKILRKALALQREAGWDPPHDVQYGSEPKVEEFGADLGVSIHTDIFAHEAFEGIDECTDIFEQALSDELIDRLEKKVHRWLKANPPD